MTTQTRPNPAVMLLEEEEVHKRLTEQVQQPMDTAGKWGLALVRELKAAGYQVDANRLL